MRPARGPRDRAVRLLVIDPASGALHLGCPRDVASLLAPGDLLVVNDAATLPASLRGRIERGKSGRAAPIEIRLTSGVPATEDEAGTYRVAVLGDGDWRTPTERRPPPPPLSPGDRLRFGDLTATVLRLDPHAPRLCDIRFDAIGPRLLEAIYQVGRPVQYAHLDAPLSLTAVQNPMAGRPVAVEPPSAGRFLTASLIGLLKRRGIGIASLTHAAGLSSTGDPAIDARLPLPEAYDLPPETVRAIREARDRGDRVVAVGTTVVRALEGNIAQNGELQAGAGMTDLRIGPGFRPRLTDAVVSGLHDRTESHFDVMAAFCPASCYGDAISAAEVRGLFHHEFGDLCIVVQGAEPELGRLELLGLSTAA
jgi:S-adenosylmethionine:tRNA ribosyltransferase-isomerase